MSQRSDAHVPDEEMLDMPASDEEIMDLSANSRENRNMASAIDEAESMDDLNISSRDSMSSQSSESSLIQDYSIRLIVDVKAVNRMNVSKKNKVMKFLTKLESVLRRNNTPSHKVEFFIGNQHFPQTIQFADKLEQHLQNGQVMPPLKTVIDRFGDTPNNSIWFIVTTYFKKKSVAMSFPSKLQKSVVLDYGRYVRSKDDGLPNYRIAACFKTEGLPIIPQIVQLVTIGDRRSSFGYNLHAPPNSNFHDDRANVQQEVRNAGYEVKRLLGRGITGPVYKYANPQGRSFALKFQEIDDLTRKSIAVEISILKKLETNSFFAVVPFDSKLTSTMVAQFFHVYTRGTLKDALVNDQLNGSLKENIVGLLAQGLTWLWRKNVLHLDIKCENVLLDQYFSPSFSDFGHARVGPEAVLDQPRGTAGYGSPENYTTQVVNFKSDTFSLGNVFYKLLSGQLLLTDEDYANIYSSQFWEQWTPRVRCGKWTHLVQQMVSVNPLSRPSCSNILAQIRQERNAECEPFRLRDGTQRSTLRERPAIMHVLSDFANINAHKELTAATVSRAVSRLAECSGVEAIVKRIRTKRLSFVIAKTRPTSNDGKFEILKKPGGRYQVKLHLCKESINNYKAKSAYWSLLKKLIVGIANRLDLYPDLDATQLELGLDTFLSLY